MNLTQQANHAIQTAKQNGLLPLAFHMNPVTAQAVLAELAFLDDTRRSALGRLWAALRRGNGPKRLQWLLGFPVLIVPPMPDGMLMLQTSGTAPMPIGNFPPADANAGPMPEFQKRERVEPGDVEKPTLTDMAKGDGITPSALLIKAMEQIDDVRGIVVLRVFANGSIDVCCNLSRYELQGVLQHGVYWAATRE